MSEMIETENLSILYLATLPNGYEFTDFRVTDVGTHLEVRAYISEPHIYFEIEVGTNQVEPNDYSYETNRIKYNTLDMGDGLYLAWWFYNGDYYSIVVDDEAFLSKIIEYL
jgi:hypothetical protein